ncbi:hypothetical protein BSK59_12950 [Paenibacillus odorifer]|uniref:glycosyltransferase n=1 Tax=Paenibacillus odorifer TaxID=189426 RepID=UPI00096FAE5F|nr:glycosyltransferase [Paenibacillus odorifer]OME55382.1 hypothetical protein BSK59_12950 [Paenibacillus odorifer]
MNKKTIVYANTIDWDFHGLTQRPHHLFKMLSETGKYKVYFVNNTKRNDVVRERISDTLEIYHDWDVFKKRVPKVDIYFSSWAKRYVDLKEIESDMVIYDSLDNFPAHEKYELEMINRSDVVLAASQPLYDLRSTQHENVLLCKNACFAEYGNKAYDIPNDLKDIKNNRKPIILFSGALASWCDIELVKLISNRYNLVVVGRPWNIPSIPEKVFYLGEKTHKELQAYYHHCDVNILPFKWNDQICHYSSPLKLWEAMAHGKPSVATNIPEAAIYPEAILSSENHNKFMDNIKKALILSKDVQFQKKSKHLASQNTWSDRLHIIDSAIEKYYKDKQLSKELVM